ncbi:uncharacterized protein F4812DRAFT_412159 [Daldinia caldariorum]|uniref:uncharacterized protein n=1 Tax=Daldinia caldariorum TaxID=326644 RepID=UPI002007A98C|nr:uncharacterized protein F4812DRAFT_412159 [Daldinia caldariorum]KAI1473265.1 hypothetical protein F4812DRAFT_412159 [Daldinia caldariorum]
MRHALPSFSIQLGLFLNVLASKLIFQPFPTQAQDGAFATLQPISTAAPEYYASIELLGRDEYHLGHDTCGFGSLDTGLTYTCYSSIGTCENIGNFRGCCTGELKACSSSFWTKCDDYNPTSYCDIYSKTRCCQSALPYCITWLFSTSSSTFTAWDCDTQSNTRVLELLATPLSLISSTASRTVTDLSTTTSIMSSTISSANESTDSPSTATGGSIVSSSTPIDATSVSSSKSSETPIGAIVGGVVGGIAIICLTILGVFLTKKYQKVARRAASPPPTPSGRQELSGFGISPAYLSPSQGNHAPGLPYGTLEQLKNQGSVAHTTTTLVAEAPNTPATGTGHNRAELG